MVIQEDSAEETLIVRQVSENSTELLGLSPKYLFSLQCFSDSLPDSQVDVLWDNIQFLNDVDLNAENDDDSPHVFLLSGWGEPGSVLPDDPEPDQFRRRSWSCWCATHRPKANTYGPEKTTSASENLI